MNINKNGQKKEESTHSSSDWNLPFGFQEMLSNENSQMYLYRTVEKKKELKDINISDPCYITKIYYNPDTQLYYKQLVWWKGKQEFSLILPAEFFANVRKIVNLSNYGFSVTSLTAPHLVAYFKGFEEINYIPIYRISSKLGWLTNEDEQEEFLFPNELISNTHEPNEVTFEGDNELFRIYQPTGDPLEWYDIIQELFPYPKIMVALYASLAAPLLHLMNIPSFFVDLSGDTGKGKTTGLLIAASPWGDPAGIIHSWASSKVSIERIADTLNHLPVFLDDTASRGNTKELSDIIYQLSLGRSADKSTVTGQMRPPRSWNTIFFSTGEDQLIDRSPKGGVPGRVLSINGSPFEDEKVDIQTIKDRLKKHHGTAGPRFITYLLRNDEKWPMYKQYLKDRTAFYADAASKLNKNRNVISRLAVNMAAIDLAGTLFDQMCEYDSNCVKNCEAVWMEIVKTTEVEADRPTNLYQEIRSWILANKNRFTEGEFPGFSPLLGKIDNQAKIAYCLKGELTQEIQRLGYEPKQIMRNWKKKDLLICDKDKTTKNTRINGMVIPTYAMRLDIED